MQHDVTARLKYRSAGGLSVVSGNKRALTNLDIAIKKTKMKKEKGKKNFFLFLMFRTKLSITNMQYACYFLHIRVEDYYIDTSQRYSR